jgi:hypothetical protein
VRDELVVDLARLADLAAVDDAVTYRDDVARVGETLELERFVGIADDAQLERRRARVDDENRAQCGQTQSRISGSSSPC